MNYIEFERALQEYPVFSVKDIEMRFPTFDNRRLVEWQNKGYLIKIIRGYYCFRQRKKDLNFNYFAANKIYAPSYISMESGLSFYNLIPEGVFSTTSITTRNTAKLDSILGNFHYRHVKTSLFFGYKLVERDGFTYKIAEVEKVILDFLYFERINSIEEMEAYRFNAYQMKEIVDFNKLENYLMLFSSPVLDKRVCLLKKIIDA